MKDLIYDIIRTGKRHEHYDYVTKRTKAWRALVSGFRDRPIFPAVQPTGIRRDVRAAQADHTANLQCRL